VVTSLAAHGPSRDGRVVNEEDPCQPVTDYGRSKLEEEKLALRYGDRLPITIVRPPAIYGPRDEQILRYFQIARWGLNILPGGENKRLNMVYVQDVVTGMILAAESSRSVGEIFFIGDNQDHDWEEIGASVGRALGRRLLTIKISTLLLYLIGLLGQILTRLTGRTYPFSMANMRNFSQRRWILDISKARRLLGYEPAYPIERGMQETVAWYREQGWL
jgi:nucleoside-diphosphate-sugar epimerase